jgi:hypothetical protein
MMSISAVCKNATPETNKAKEHVGARIINQFEGKKSNNAIHILVMLLSHSPFPYNLDG